MSPSTHEIESEQTTEAWRGTPYKKILVVDVSDDRALRVSSESVFVSEFSEKAVEALSSFETFPDLGELDELETVRARLDSVDCDAVLTITVVEEGPEASQGWKTYVLVCRTGQRHPGLARAQRLG